MATVVRIPSGSKPKDVRKALEKFRKLRKKGKRTLSDFYGKLPNVFGDGMTYQKKIRNAW